MNLHDRCDGCNAQAFYRFEHMVRAQDLMFCGHHNHEYGAALLSKGFILTEAPAPTTERAAEVLT